MLNKNGSGTPRKRCARREGPEPNGTSGPQRACPNWSPRDDAPNGEKVPKSGKTSKNKMEHEHKTRMKKIRRRSRGYVQIRLRPRKIEVGGDHYFGDIRQKKRKSWRIFFQNLGGFPTDPMRMRTTLEEVKTFGADYIGLQETKINHMNRDTINKIQGRLFSVMKAESVFSSNSDEFTKSYWKPGGMATLLIGPFKSKKNCTWADPTSTIQRTRIKNTDVKLSIINIYLPRFKTGPTGTYYQTLNTIRKMAGRESAEEIKSYFYETIRQKVMEDAGDGYMTIIGGDFNEDNLDKGEMAKTLKELALVNITSPKDESTPATHASGTKTIDHIWISKGLTGSVTGLGYLPFGLGFDADHRGMYVDIRSKEVDVMQAARRRRRKLKSKNPKSVKSYLKIVTKLVKQHNIETRLAKLEGKNTLNDKEKDELESIDSCFTEIQLHAESKLQIQRTNDLFSDKLHEAKKVRHYWRRIYSLSKSDTHYSLSKYNHEHDKGNIELPIKIIKQRIGDSSRLVDDLRKDGLTHRKNMLEAMVDHEEKRGGGTAGTAPGIKAILNAEKSRRQHATLRKHKQTMMKRGMGLETPTNCASIEEMWWLLKEKRAKESEVKWRMTTSEEENTEYLLRWCTRHFGQASETPLASLSWRNRLDPRRAENILDDIIEGKFKLPTGYPMEMSQFFQAARSPEGVRPVLFKLTYEHYIRFCRKQDERKESSPSGLHYGHVKTLLFDETLLRIKYKIIELAYTHGILLNRWTTLWEALIPKKQRSYIHKFRNITLIEGDLQYLMKAIWSQAFMRAITPILNDSQNAVTGRVTQSSILGHRIALDTIFVNGEDCIIVENDAVNCFDRIIPIIAALAFLRMGLAAAIIQFYLTLLENARHYIIVDGAPSPEYYAHSRDTPIMGSGQGTGWAGPSWFAVADLIFTALAENQPGMYLVSPDRKTEDFRIAEASVDDARQGVNSAGAEKFNKENGSNLTVAAAANRANQAFERYLSLTGGRLALDKTMFYALYPQHGRPEKRYRPTDSLDITLKLNENFGTVTEELKMYKPEEAHKLLGVLTDPASTTKEQIDYMVSQAKEWNSRLRNAPIPSSLKRLSYTSELIPRLTYPLPAISLTQKECRTIMNHAMPTIKHGLGLSSTTETEILFFPKSFGGYGVLDLHLAQLVEQSKFIVQHLRNRDSVGRRIKISIEVSQLESGKNQKITRNGTAYKTRYITPTILTTLMENLWDLRAEIWLDHWTPAHGRTIMEEIQSRVRDQGQLSVINTCRTWLRVHYLSDLATINGRKIHPAYMQGKRAHASKWSWPRWVPPESSWYVWKSSLRSYIAQTFPLKHRPMGHQIPTSWIDKNQTSVEHEGDTYRIETRKRHRSRLTPQQIDQSRTDPCDVHEDGGELFLIPGQQLATIEEHKDPITETFLESLIAMEPTLGYIFKKMPHLEADHNAIADLMIQDNLVAGSDGGDDQNGRIVCAITIASEDLLDCHTSGHEVYGDPRDSGRAEMTGVTAVILYLCQIIKWHDLPRDTSVSIYSDSSETVRFANELWLGKTPRWADERNIEMKRVINLMLRTIGKGLRVEHTLGHQDKTAKPEDLPLPARINIICDRGCTRVLQSGAEPERQRGTHGMMTCSEACIAVKGEPITGKMHHVLARRKYATKVAKHLKMSKIEFDEVDWVSHSRAVELERSPALKRIIWGHHPTRSRMKMQGRCQSGTCILCGENDARDHFLECTKMNNCTGNSQLKDRMRHRARAQGAPDHLVNVITQVMAGKQEGEGKIPRHARPVHEIQKEIGWDHFRRGRIAKSWSKVKTTDSDGRLRPDERWRTGITRVILQWLLQKWILRCEMIRTPEAEHDHGALLEICQRWWTLRGSKRLLRIDMHLTHDHLEPQAAHSTDYLREWLRTRTLAENAFKRYRPGKDQPTLHRWLVRKEG